MIGWYVHHQGRGHLHRALAIAHELTEPVVALSSLPEPDAHPFAHWIRLPDDVGAAGEQLRAHNADGALHWAPLGADGYRERMATIASWLASDRPRLVVVDVSVEVAAFVRLAGVPVVVVAGAGDRSDPPHDLVHRLAERIIAPWPAEVYRPDHLRVHARKVRHVGALSRLDGRPAPPPPGHRRVLVLMGAGGTDVRPEDVEAAALACPGWTWTALGTPGSWVEDVWGALCDADVVVTHAGQNLLAEVAAARRPAVVVPQVRPFDEQLHTARALAADGIAEVRETWPEPGEWPGLLECAYAAGGTRWARWNPGTGAAAAARVLEVELADA